MVEGVETQAVRAQDGFVAVETQETLLALVPEKPGVVLTVSDGHYGVGNVEAEDWDDVRAALTDPETARTAAGAASVSLKGSTGAGVTDGGLGLELGDPEATVFSRALRVLHNDSDGIATAAFDGVGTVIAYAADDSPAGPSVISVIGTASTSTIRSRRSRSGPDSRL